MFNQDLLSLLRVSAGSEKMLRRNSVVELWMMGGGEIGFRGMEGEDLQLDYLLLGSEFPVDSQGLPAKAGS